MRARGPLSQFPLVLSFPRAELSSLRGEHSLPQTELSGSSVAGESILIESATVEAESPQKLTGACSAFLEKYTLRDILIASPAAPWHHSLVCLGCGAKLTAHS